MSKRLSKAIVKALSKTITGGMSCFLAGTLIIGSCMGAFTVQAQTPYGESMVSGESEESVEEGDSLLFCNTATSEDGSEYGIECLGDASQMNGMPSLDTRRERLNSATLHPMKTNIPEIDDYIGSLLDRITTPDMDTYSKVKACYDYLVNNWSYGGSGYYLNDYPYYFMFESSYDAMIALFGYESLKTNIGVCDNYAAAFVLMTRRIGLESYSVGGRIGRTEATKLGHAWANIKINGTYYLFDPQVEDNVTKNGNINYYYFCMLDSETWSGYDYDDREGRIAAFRNFNVFKMTECSINPPGVFVGGSSTLTVKTSGKTDVEYNIYTKGPNESEPGLYDYGTGNTYTIKFSDVGHYEIKVEAVANRYAKISKTFSYNVLDKAKVDSFVKRLYKKCLNRDADASGLAYWENALLNPNQSGASVAYGFVFSPEYTSKKVSDAEYVEMLYNVFMDRASDSSGKKYWMGLMEQGLSREYVYNGFATSKEFTNICNNYGITRGSIKLKEARDQNAEMTKFVNRIYVKAMERSGEVDGLNYWCGVIQSKKMTPVQVAEYFILSEEFTKKNLDDTEYVKVLYRTFMGREYDQAGLNYWLGKLSSGVSRKKVLESFAGCPEFQKIIQSFGL